MSKHAEGHVTMFASLFRSNLPAIIISIPPFSYILLDMDKLTLDIEK